MIVHRGTPGYESLRRALVANAHVPDRYPDAIVRPLTAYDVVDGIAEARRSGLPVVCRAGGHSWYGSSLRDGALVLDLSELRELQVAAEERRVRAGPGATMGDLTDALEAHGLGFPAGHGRDVGLGGYLLSGGLGWNGGFWGPACHSLVGMEAVTADGLVVAADAAAHDDLLWAARGAGPGFFAAVTGFDLRVYAAPRSVLSSVYAFPLSAVDDVGEWIREIGVNLDKRLELSLAFARAPAPINNLDIAAGQPVVVVTAVAFTDSREDGMALLEPLERGVGRRGLRESESHRETPQQALYEMTGARLPPARRVAADCLWTDGDPHRLLATLGEALVRAPSADSWILVSMYPTESPEVEALPSAFSRAGRFYVALYSLWEERNEAPTHEAWLARAIEDLQPLTAGRYVGEADLAARPEEARRCYSPATWERLATTRERYDPGHVFAWYPDRS